MMKYRRTVIVIGLILGSLLSSAVLQWMPDRAMRVTAAEEASPQEPGVLSTEAYAGEVHERFQQAAAMLHAGEYLYALEALARVIELAPNLPEARVNAGFALLGLGEPARAVDAFLVAIDLRPQQANAYYGLAVARERLGDLDSALGAMRTYVHLVDDNEPYARRAWSAIWEWQRLRDQESIGAADANGALDGQTNAVGG